MILDDIIKEKRAEVLEERGTPDFGTFFAELKDRVARVNEVFPARDFKSALTGPADQTRIIAEVKKASPSEGIIREDFDALELAREYEANGAAAISVLTDKKFFQGRPEYVTLVRNNVDVPVLRKDFLIDEYQVYESRGLGADAVLLIAAILTDKALEKLIKTASHLGMAPLVEVHTEGELAMALGSGAEIIGVNNRDLKTFDTDLETTVKIAEKVPDGKVLVSESGIKTRGDIERLAPSGVDAFLVGTTLAASMDAGAKLRELRGAAG